MPEPRASRTAELRIAADRCEEALRRFYGVDKILWRVETAGKAMDTSVETLRAWIRSGLLRAVRIGRNVYIPRDEIDRLISEYREDQP